MATIIRTDTTYKSGETINLTDDIQVAEGSKLTIEAGVTINGNGHSIKLYGSLDINGLKTNSVNINNVVINAGEKPYATSHINFNYVRMNEGAFLPATGNGGYVSFDLQNSIFTAVKGFYLWYPDANSTITGNIFSKCEGLSTGISNGFLKISNNIFENWTTGYAVENWADYNKGLEVTYNSFLTNQTALSLRDGYTSSGIDKATNNYFGTTNTSVIDSMILDNNDSLGRSSIINYSPFLSSPDINTPHLNAIPSGTVKITGITGKNQTLIASNNLTDPDGLGAISYQWLNNGAVIPNANQANYKLTQSDSGQNISVKASYVDLQNTSESVTSSNIQIASNSSPIGAATIKGLATWGTTLSVTNTIKDADGIGKLSYSWQNDSGELSTNATYTLAETNIGKKVWVTVSYTDKKGNLEAVKSNVLDVTISTKASAVNDILTGNDGADKLSSLAGNDTLVGGLGKDTLTGGVGSDIFKFISVNDSSAISKQGDRITDFKHSQGDRIDLSGIDANSTLPSDQAFKYIGTIPFGADATAQLRLDPKTGILYGSTNSDNMPEFSILLSGIKVLVAEDFIL